VIIQQVNLFQPIFRKERKLLSFRVLLQGSGAVFLLLTLVFVWSWRQSWQMETGLANLHKQLEDRTSKVVELGQRLAAMKTGAEPNKELIRMERELIARQQVVDALTRVRETYTRGVSGYLESFSRQAPKGVWLTGFSLQGGGEDIVIRGSSLKPALVPVFIQQLSAEPILSGTQFGLLQIQREKKETQYVDFTVYTGSKPPKAVTQ